MQGKYNSIVLYDVNGVAKAIAEDMPVFPILGQDALGGAAIGAYVEALLVEGLHRQADEAAAFLLDFQAWQAANPDRVRLPD